ncbi:17268_t:CDS:2, partial [Cetraspora pellucida]
AGIQFASTPYMNLSTIQHSVLLFQSQPVLNQTSTNQTANILFAITPLDLALSSTINAEEPPYKQQLQVHIDFITNKLQQVQLKAQQNIETA